MNSPIFPNIASSAQRYLHAHGQRWFVRERLLYAGALLRQSLKQRKRDYRMNRERQLHHRRQRKHRQYVLIL